MSQYIKRAQRDYSLSFKLAVVEQVEKGEMTCRQATDRYGISRQRNRHELAAQIRSA